MQRGAAADGLDVEVFGEVCMAFFHNRRKRRDLRGRFRWLGLIAFAFRRKVSQSRL